MRPERSSEGEPRRSKRRGAGPSDAARTLAALGAEEVEERLELVPLVGSVAGEAGTTDPFICCGVPKCRRLPDPDEPVPWPPRQSGGWPPA